MHVIRHDEESQENLLRRFQRMMQTSGILQELKTRRFFMSKSEKARIAARKAARRHARRRHA